MIKENLGTRSARGGWDILRLMEFKEILEAKETRGRVGDYDLVFDYLPNGKVWYKPLDGRVPCGYTSLDAVTAKITAIMETENL